MLFGELHQGRQIQRVAICERERSAQAGLILDRRVHRRVCGDLQPPSLGRESRLNERVALQRVRLGVAAGDITELVGRCQQGMRRRGDWLRPDDGGSLGCLRRGGRKSDSQRGRGQCGAAANEVPAREGIERGRRFHGAA